jgi:hypothetical protein
MIGCLDYLEGELFSVRMECVACKKSHSLLGLGHSYNKALIRMNQCLGFRSRAFNNLRARDATCQGKA